MAKSKRRKFPQPNKQKQKGDPSPAEILLMCNMLRAARPAGPKGGGTRILYKPYRLLD